MQHEEEIRIGILAPQPEAWDFFGSTFSTMVTLALEDINDPKKFKDIFPNKKGRKKLSYVVAHMPPANETTDVAPEIAAIRGIMNMIRTNRIHLLLGPTLNLDFDSMAMMPGVFNITQIGLFPQGERFTYQQRYPFLTLLGYSFDRFGQALAHFCHTHNWKRIAVIWNSKLPVPRSFRQEAASLNLEIVADEYIVSVDSVQNVPNLEEVNKTLDYLPDYKENFDRIRNANVDVILSFPFSQDCWHLYKQAIKYAIAPYHGFQWVAAGTLSAMSYPRDNFYSCSIPENVTCSVGFTGMIQVVQYLLRDIEQWELWTELERRVNMLDPSVYDRTIQYPRRFTFLILGMVYDAVLLFMKAVSDLIEMNATLTAEAITKQMRESGFRGIFPGPLSFEGGDRSGYRGVIVHILPVNNTSTANVPELNYEINYGFELSIDPQCDQPYCRRLIYFRLRPDTTPVLSESWPAGKEVERRYFLGADPLTMQPMFGNSSGPVIFSCTTGCGGNKSVDPLALWIPGGCDIFNSFIEYRHYESKRFKKNAVEKLWRMVGEYYKELVEALVKQGHQGIVDIVKSCSSIDVNSSNVDSIDMDSIDIMQCVDILAEFPLRFPSPHVISNQPAGSASLVSCQVSIEVDSKNAYNMTMPNPKCLYNNPLCSVILNRCNVFEVFGSLNMTQSETCDGPTSAEGVNLLEVCHLIPVYSNENQYISCLGLNVTGSLCEAITLHNHTCSEYPQINRYNNGKCVSKDVCNCNKLEGKVAWAGANCSIAVCDGVCNGRGDCISPQNCHCHPGYTLTLNGGQCYKNCSEMMAYNNSMGPGGDCLNGGTCVEVPRQNLSVYFYGETREFSYTLKCSCTSGYSGDRCENVDKTISDHLVEIIVPSVAISFLLVVIVVAAVQYNIRKMRIRDELANTDWRSKWEDLFFQPDQRPFGWRGRGSSSPIVDGRTGSMIRVGSVTTPLPDCAIFKGQMVAVKRVDKVSVKLTEEILAEIRFMRSTRHVNIIPFIGVCIDPPHVLILTEYTSKGCLRDVLSNKDIRLDWAFRYSLARDLAQGMDFLHHSDAQWHGRLTSNNCLIDSHWVLKITDFGLHQFKQGEQSSDDVLELQKLLWVAPELLVVSEPHSLPIESMITGLDPKLQQLVSRSQYVTRQPGGTKLADVYSFGMILYELMMRQLPFYDSHLPLKQVIAHVQRDPEFRPSISDNCPVDFCEFMQKCWADCPEYRPPFGEVLIIIKKMHDPGTLVDNMVQMLEKYSSNLEHLVEQRTQALADEKSRSEELLYRMIPKKVAQQLKSGSKITAEQFEEVTVCFCDIVAFTKIAAKSTPLQVIGLLNDLYSRFDYVIDDYNVFKLGTIGDAYIIVSGLPERTGPQHAPEIANTALDLMASINGFKIKHFPDHQLQLRVGIHSGTCVAGVVGLKVPHYCVFGDTVNIASRMESTGLALRIHLSSTTTRILRRIGGYHVETRGKISIKGRGPMVTAWLLGRDGFNKELPSLDAAISEEDHEFKA
ncbi:uncharacterized protein LOC134193301 isoform X2 [Corticium candelabrum]|uniref:uncharacterized protein LOC134193301 isoform X2 n=1 Tax=Corticium candelabrum TaxID=121492 RepID=UPI002E271579|nr:uncharacterized protein LOC134193301 isoform X2 [Corticium candelabrum]